VAEHLRSVGEYRRKRELVDALAGDSTLGRRTWWERAVRPGLGRLADRDLVEYTRNRGYRWSGHLDRDGDRRYDRRERRRRSRPGPERGRHMSRGGSTCAMCGDRLAEPYSGYRLPAPCIQLLDGGDEIDPSTVAGKVAVDLCKECTHVARPTGRKRSTDTRIALDDIFERGNIHIVVISDLGKLIPIPILGVEFLTFRR
jgi:hypothetical protein